MVTTLMKIGVKTNNKHIFLLIIHTKNGDYMKYNLQAKRTDFTFFNSNNNFKLKVFNNYQQNYLYKTILFNNYNNKQLSSLLTKELIKMFNFMKIDNNSHILIIGLGNEDLAADSIGPKTLKYINVNSYLDNLHINVKGVKVSTLKPGVLSKTGILTEKIIKSVIKEINPNLVILIDSFVSNNIEYLNKSIELNNYGLKQNCGIKGLTSNLTNESLNTKVLVIGVNTAIEIINKNKVYLLTSNDINDFVNNISKILGNSLNQAISSLS